MSGFMENGGFKSEVQYFTTRQVLHFIFEAGVSKFGSKCG